MAGPHSALPAEPLEEPSPTPGHGEAPAQRASPRGARALSGHRAPDKHLPGQQGLSQAAWPRTCPRMPGTMPGHGGPMGTMPSPGSSCPSHPTPPQQMPSSWGPWPRHPQNALHPARSLRPSRAPGRMDGQTDGAPGTCPHPVPQWAQWEGRSGVPEALSTGASRGIEGPGTAAWEGAIPVLPQDDALGPCPTRRANTAAQHRGAAAPSAPDGPHAAAVAAAAGRGLTPAVTAPTRACAHQPDAASRTRSRRR